LQKGFRQLRRALRAKLWDQPRLDRAGFRRLDENADHGFLHRKNLSALKGALAIAWRRQAQRQKRELIVSCRCGTRTDFVAQGLFFYAD
jgi:hypothetical protein